MESKTYEEVVDVLREMTKVQCTDGNWNYSPYMHGMANGMIFSLSFLEGKRPEYLNEPDIWLQDISDETFTLTLPDELDSEINDHLNKINTRIKDGLYDNDLFNTK